MPLTLMALLCNLYIRYCTSHCVPTVHYINCKLIPIHTRPIALHCKHQSYIYFPDIYNSLHVLMISDHSHTAVTELFCKIKQPLLSYFKLNLLTRDPGDDKVQINFLQRGNTTQSSCLSSIAQEDLTGQQHLEIQSSKIVQQTFLKEKSYTCMMTPFQLTPNV